jgi:hypothetical protein
MILINGARTEIALLTALASALALLVSWAPDDAPGMRSRSIPLVPCSATEGLRGNVPAKTKQDVRVGTVRFRGLRPLTHIPQAELPTDGTWHPLKAPLILRSGLPATVVSLKAVGSYPAELMVYGKRGQRIAVQPCPPTAKRPRTAFLGGFRVKGPTCVALSVSSHGSPRATKRVPIGQGSCGETP